MENLLYLNALMPYVYLILFYTSSKIQDSWGLIYELIAKGMIIEIIFTLIISLLASDKSKLAKVNFKVKLIQIPYYIIFFVLASGIFGILMALCGVGIFVLPILIAIDAAIFATTVIPAQICTIKLKKNQKITTGKMISYLIFNMWYIVDLFLASKIRKRFISA
ncbi:hypothetical protein SAMN05216249_1195 [Acetitomaculum ruminis DSM 5522]|uniref:Uncharacterized protein n=1 Tax=Acetitomaculum ruminis DSM 5522 TaxID=1120918 RepID=A0A1I0ZYE7_9FIRM|nr:hypothetical protein [Acetitomaculum ruminis]SFB30759.1 hypothetical protein SAMN05216249_1195 [Acetitomaculum ruminis DSM 5522]